MRWTFFLYYTSLATFVQGSRYEKRLALDDPDAESLIKILTHPPPKEVKSVFQCSVYANKHKFGADRSKRPSAFKYINGTCTLARAPPFIDQIFEKDILSDEENGYYTLMEKPRSKVVHSDIWIYLLLNEELQFNLHENLPNPPDPSGYDKLENIFSFDKESPVKTFGGHMAGRFVNSYLEFKFPKHPSSAITLCAWYNPGPSLTNEDLLINVFAHLKTRVELISLLVGPTGSVHIFTILGDGENIFSNDGVITANTWHYTSATYDFSTGKVNIYVDGNPVFSGTRKTNGPILFDTLQLGHMTIALQPYYTTGYVASAEIYDRILDADQIAEAMAKSTTTRVGM